jgi:pimeloyl-ACP methyl ester carboxylesterase
MRRMKRRKFMLAAGGLLLSPVLPAAMQRRHDADFARREALRFESQRRFARTPYGDVAYVARGSGRAVLMLHGFPLNGFQWRGAIERLCPHARCIAPDLLGMGHSRAAPGQDVGPDAQVLMLAWLMKSLGVRHFDVIANDSGGAVAQLLAARHPIRVRSLLLTNCDTEFESPPAAMRPVIELAKQGRFVDEWLAPWLESPQTARSVQGIGGLCYADATHPTDEALRMYFDPPVNSPERRQALHRYAVALERNALAGITPVLGERYFPTRIVWGMADSIFASANADFLHRSFGNSVGVERLADGKLFWPEERPEVIATQARMLWRAAPA